MSEKSLKKILSNSALWSSQLKLPIAWVSNYADLFTKIETRKKAVH